MKYIKIILLLFLVGNCFGMVQNSDQNLQELDTVSAQGYFLLGIADDQGRRITVDDFLVECGFDYKDSEIAPIKEQLLAIEVVNYNHICNRVRGQQEIKTALYKELLHDAHMKHKIQESYHDLFASIVANRNKAIACLAVTSMLALTWSVATTIWAINGEVAC